MSLSKSFYFLVVLGFYIPFRSFSQNVGIETTTPNRAKLEVSGAVGSTAGLIWQGVAGTGVSFQRNAPGIGFNQYYTDQARYITNGRACVLGMDVTNGNFELGVYYTLGSSNLPASGLVKAMLIRQNGNVSFYAGEANASLFVGSTPTFVGARIRGTTHHSEFNYVSGSSYWTRINAGKDGGDVYINDANYGYIIFGGRTEVNTGITSNATLLIQQLAGRGIAVVDPTTFHNWELITTKNLTDPASDYYTYYNGAYKGNFFYIDGDYYPISDQRLKKNITSLPRTIDKVMLLKPKLYHFKNFETEATKSIGLIAQQVQTVFPELVELVGEGNTGYPGIKELYSMNYYGLAPIAIKAIQEQQVKIAELKTRNENLRKKIETLESLIK